MSYCKRPQSKEQVDEKKYVYRNRKNVNDPNTKRILT